MRVFNTATRSVEDFAPLDGKHVRMYTCGPTVYGFAHIGNLRTFLFEDMLRRTLKFAGYDVTQVMNLTDVDDKTIKGCAAAGVSLDDFTKPYKTAFFEDLATLNIQPAEHYPAATDHIEPMIALIEKLMEKGFAYQSDDGSVYFRIASHAAYGCLVNLDADNMQVGARVENDEYEKEVLADFALWKAWREEDGDVAWDSPWGRGRPGWHIECSAMSMQYLGETFDLHTGGVDNKFPHHEDEIAQSECATGKTFVRYWMHSNFLLVEGKKMSKSLGNFYTLRDLVEKGYSPRAIRYALMSAHYRQLLNFTINGLEQAQASLARIDEFVARLRELASVDGDETPGWASDARDVFTAAMEDDLNVPEALAAVFTMVNEGHAAMDRGELTAEGGRAALSVIEHLDQVLGLLVRDEDGPGPEVEELLQRREAARAAKDWGEADRLRDELAAAGWIVKDTPQGARLRRSP